jgi:hypothetical protein
VATHAQEGHQNQRRGGVGQQDVAIPQQGDALELAGLALEIEKMEGPAIVSIIVRIVGNASESDDG